MSDFNALGFALVGLKTNQFAIIEEAYKKTGDLDIKTEIGFAIDEKNRIIAVRVKFNFEKKKEQPFIIISTQANFQMNKEGWKLLYHSDEAKYVLPNKLMTHLTVLTVGTTRGVLHAKTEGTIFNSYILPTVNVANLINEDVIFKSN